MTKPFSADKVKGLPFTEAIDYARSRKVELPADYYGNAVQAHRAKATTITGAASIAQIEAVMKDLQDSLAAGGTFAQWKEKVSTQSLKLPEHRLDNVYRTNVQAAYNKGRYEQQTGSLTRTYWMYDAINDSRTRPAHLAMDNVVLSRDDSWWDTHYPPNGYRCRCTVIALTPAQAIARGISTDKPSNADPDPGWDYNPGKDYTAPDTKTLDNKKPTLAPAAKRKAVKKVQDAAAAATPTYEDIYALGESSLESLLAGVGTWNRSTNRVMISSAGAAEVKERFEKALAARAKGSTVDFKTTARGGTRPKAVEAGAKRFLKLLPVKWQQRLSEATAVDPLNFQDATRIRDGRAVTQRASFNPGPRLVVAPSDSYQVVVHETAHFVQHTMPDVDKFFYDHHVSRTAGTPLEQLNKLGNSTYRPEEVTRKDEYFNVYVGKEYFMPFDMDVVRKAVEKGKDTTAYNGRPLELMAMAFENFFGTVNTLRNLIERDPRLVSTLLGLLLHYE